MVMLKREMPSIDRSKGTDDPSKSSYQSVWMAHWKVAKLSPPSKPEILTPNHMASEIASDCTSELVGTSSLSDVPKMDRQFSEVPAKNSVKMMDVASSNADIVDGKTVAIASQYLTEEGPTSMPYPAVAPLQPVDDCFSLRNQRGSSFSYHEVWNPLVIHNFPKNQIEGSANVLEHPFESENFVVKKSIVSSTQYQESPLGLTSRQVPHSLDAAEKSLTFPTDKFDRHASMATPSLWNRTASPLLNGYTPTCQKSLLTYPAENRCEDYHQMLPSESSPLEVIECKTSCYEHSSRPRHNVVDVMSTRTHTSVDSTKRLTAETKFSRAMHQLFYSDKTDTRLSKRGRIFRESTVYASYQENSTRDQFLSLSTDDNYHGNPGVKLQQLRSSTDSESHENLAKVKTSAIAAKNESSAETNTLDMDALTGKRLSGEASLSPKKGASAGKVSGSLAKVRSTGMKREFLTLVTMPGSKDDRELSPSRPQSLEVDRLLPHDYQRSHLNPKAHTHYSGGVNEPEQRDGRMKQLNATNSDQVQESLKSGQASPVRKVNDLSSRISKQMKVNLRLDMAIGSGERVLSTKGGVSTSGDKTLGRKGQGTLHSNQWIRRWCHHNKTTAVSRKKQELVRTKTSDELRKKQLPSVAAMALMGKAMNGFRPCEFTRKGSVVVWKS